MEDLTSALARQSPSSASATLSARQHPDAAAGPDDDDGGAGAGSGSEVGLGSRQHQAHQLMRVLAATEDHLVASIDPDKLTGANSCSRVLHGGLFFSPPRRPLLMNMQSS